MRLTTGGEDKDLAGLLDEALTAFNAEATGAHDGEELSVRAEDGDGTVAGGLTGWTWGDSCEVHMLWVRADRRGSGLGTRLMREAEAEARRRGCRHMAVSSYTFQAPGFYEKLGYTVTGRTPGVPGGHEDVHLYRRLEP
ncbi:GNAT family N-acetyltransferase [Streptomyces sp. CC53]|uniref:GNAT family N-acetyltransferase n=1 Tax=unclassified Streptomyces TaxID=2593676 RepID=UPI0008DC70D4|nr:MULTISPECIES: GNAT family N-acetyltransferase [unclassified Streptomyces]OII60917.1 GNAT family N-acetyltransferase [Streptomyces sp. CC53]